MLSPKGLETSSVANETASTPSFADSSNQSGPPTCPVSNYRLGTAAIMPPNTDANNKPSGSDPGPSTSPARAPPQQIPSSEDSNHDDEPKPSSAQATKSKKTPLRPKARVQKKTLGKRLHADSNANPAISNGAGVVPAKKRVRNNALMRSAPRATSTITPGGLAGNSEFMNFTATIFIIQLGPDGPQFHAHESVLKRSPKLAEEIDKAKANKRATKQNTLPLMAHDAIAFEQMLQFLYKDKFLMSKNKSTPNERLGELKELMSLAKHYVLPGLQKQIVKLFSSSKILSKIAPGDFFDWAEDMYSEELNQENGPFKVYLSKVAPMLMKGADEATRKGLVQMVKQGGGFAEQLFIAAATALDMQTNLTVIKKEEKGEKAIAVRPRDTKGKDKEPVRQTAREEENVENNDHLFIET